jgi:chemotaxis family two-component system response regulator Rcp1
VRFLRILVSGHKVLKKQKHCYFYKKPRSMNNNETSHAIHILLVEDNIADIRLTEEVLKDGKLNNRLSVVKDGEEAIFFLKKEGKYKDADTPDIILLDLNLPKKDGRQVLAEIKADPVLMLIPVIVLTTSSSEKDIISTYANHGNCYITKPVDFDQFIYVITTIENFWLTIVKLPNHN